jgi:hypothetical protein
MTISEFKKENHKPITEEVASTQALYDGSHANAGDVLLDCYLVDDVAGDDALIYITSTILESDFDIVEDLEYDVFLPLSEQKFKVKLK